MSDENKNSNEVKSQSALESAVTSLLAEQVAARKSATRAAYVKWAIIGILGLLYLGIVVSVRGVFNTGPSKPYASVVVVSGEIGPGKSASAEKLNPLLEEAFKDKDAKGVIIRVNSPGGTPVQSSFIHDKIMRLKKEYKKPVVVVGEDMVTSGAYFISTAADKIIVNRSTIIGSIGVISANFGFTGLMDKLGVERRVVTAGESKNLLDPFSPPTEKGLAAQHMLVGKIHEHFKDTVKAGRPHLNLNNPELFSGMIWVGSDSLKEGLADELGDMDTAKAYLGVKDTVDYVEDSSIITKVLGKVAVSAGEAMAAKLTATDTPVSLQ